MLKSLLRAALLLAICAAAFAYANHVPSVVPASAPDTEFSAERAMAHVRVIADRPHPIGTAEHRGVAEYLLAQLRGLGYEPQVQEATAIGTRYAAAGRVRNILVRFAGTDSAGARPAVLLMSHYDGVPSAPAAGDAASGTAVLLETLRALTASPRLRHDVIVLITDGEETGLLGAAAFVREHPWAKDVAVTLNFEARGTRGPSLMFETGPGNLDVARTLRRVGGVRATSLSTFVYRLLPNDTDISETARLGQPAMNFAFIGGVNRYHTSQDDVAHLDVGSVQGHGNSALALARELAGNPLPRPVTGDAVFFDVPLIGLVVYPESWALPLSLLLLVPLGFVLLAARREHPRWWLGILVGIAGAVASVGLAVVSGILKANALRSLHASLESGMPTQSGIYTAAIAVLALAIASGVFAICRTRIPAAFLHIGGAILLAVLGWVTAAAAPAVSFLFVWPALAVLIALAFRRFGAGGAEIALWIATVVAVLIILPIAYLMGAVALGLDATGAAVVAAFTVLGAWLLAHILELAEGRTWRNPVAIATLSVVLFVIGMATVRTSDAAPVGSSFGYGVDADSNTAYLGVHAQTRGALNALRRGLGNDPAVPPPGWFARYFRVARPAPPPGSAIGRATVTVMGDVTRGDSSWVTIRVTPAPGVREINLRADSGVVRAAVIDGRPVATDGYRYAPRGRWSIDYVAPPAGGFDLVLAVVPGRPVTLALVSQLAGIAPVPGIELPARPPGVIPIQRGEFTLVHQRARIR